MAGVRRASILALTTALTLVPRAAFGQPNPEERALADTRFEEGRALMSQQRFDDACAKFEESERLWPRGGAALNLAACRERQGKIASAWATYTRALGLARKEGRSDREELAKTKIAELEGLLSWLAIEISPELQAAGAEVTRDGASVGRGAWGVAVPVDAGRHVVVARVPGSAPIEVVVDVGPRGDRRVVHLPPSSGPSAIPTPSVAPAASPTGRRAELGADGVIRLHIESPRPVRLVGGMDSSTARGMNLPICSGSCDAVIDARYWQSLRFEGDGIPDSESFFAGDRKGDVVARVAPGSAPMTTTGTLLVVVGLAGGIAGGIVLIAAATHDPGKDPSGRANAEAGGAVALGGSGAAIVAGILLRLSGRTTFTLSDGPRAPVRTGARGLSASF